MFIRVRTSVVVREKNWQMFRCLIAVGTIFEPIELMIDNKLMLNPF